MSRFGLVCAAVLVAVLLAPGMGAQAQQRRSPDAPNLLRQQAAPARLGPVPVDRDLVVDQGDAYLTPSGEVRLQRVTNEAAVRYADGVAATEGFSALQRSLAGRSVERAASIAPSGIDIVRDPSVGKEGQAAAGTPNALAETLAGAAGVARTYPVFVAPDGTTRMVAADEILVCLKEGASTESLAPRFAAAGAVVDRKTRANDLDVYVVRLQADAKGDALATSIEMSAWPGVAWAQPNFTRELSLSAAPNDPLFGMQQGLYNWGQNGGTANADMNWKTAWEIVQGDPNIVIAIIDDGVDTSHPDLLIAPGGYDFYNDDDDPSPVGTDGHGTGCAGVAAATVNNATNMAGVAGGCGILPIKIAESSFATDEVIGDAIRYAADHADILSNSWGGGTSNTYIDSAIDYATTSGRDGSGCPVFFATGNSASLWYQGGGRNTVSFEGVVGDYYFGFTYEKDDSVSQGLDAAWVDNVCILDADGYSRFWFQHFENPSFPPPGWTVQTNAGPGAYWTKSATAEALGGTGGAASAKSGAISHSQYTTLRSPLMTFSGTETVAVAAACSSEAGYDALYLDLFDSGGNLAGWVPLATGVPTVTTDLAYPASYANAIAVGSATDCDLRADYSQYGTGLDFLAPSNGGWNDVVTLDPVGSVGWNDTDYKMNFGGTSSACPAAAGIAALALSADPGLTAGGVRALMRKSCDKVGRVIYSGGDAGAGGWHEMYGYGRLNALAVVASAAYEQILFNPFDTDPGWSTEGQWEFGPPQGNTDDPSSAYSGTNVYGYNLAGNYDNDIPEHFLTTPGLDCSLHQDVRLQFRRWLGVESATWDQARIQVSNDGTTWVDVWSNSVGSMVDTNWQLVNYDISAVADGRRTVYVRWGMGPTDGSGRFCGWNIDDFELLGLPAGRLNVAPAADFESAGYQGGPFTPASFDYTLTNDGTEPLTWSASHATSWLDVTPSSGALDPGADAVVTLSFNAKANLLAEGTHTGTVVFTNDVTGVSETRDVSLDVAPIPGEIEVTDSAAPADDHLVPFGVVPVGVAREEQVYIRNVNDEHPLIVSDLDITATYVEDFEDGEAQDWVPMNSAHWSVVGGEYQASTSDYSTSMQSSYPAQVWEDASVSVRMRRTGGMGAVSAVFMRCSADFDYATDAGSAYGVGITGNGSFWVVKWVEGVLTWLQSWTDSPFLNEGETPNDVTLSVERTAIRVYFNGNLAWTGSDGSIAGPGSIALAGYSGSSDPLAVHYFDDVLVQQPFEGEVTVTAEQAWYNQHGLADGDPNEAPVGLEPPEYTGVPSKPRPLDVRAASVTGTPFSLIDPPVMPFYIGPGDVVTVRVACEPDRAAFVEGTLWIESNDAMSPGLGVALSVKGETAVPFVSEPFDADPGWSTEGQWEFGAPQGSQGDPSSAYTGSDVYGYNLDGAYANDIPEHFLTTTAFDCTSHGNVQLQFRRWLGVESSSKDHARIQASNDGATWVDVWEHQGATLVDTDWQLVSYDISAVADGQSTVYVRWGMGPTDSAVVYGGWNIDDVALVGTPLAEDLDISPETDFDSSGYEGGPFSPASIDYTLTNEGSDPLTWTLAYAAPWLDVSSTGGTLDPAADTVVTVSLNAEADLLAPGLYTDALQFTNYLSGVPQTRQVTLDVAPIPGEIQVTDSVDPADDHAVPFGLVQLHHPREEEVYVDNLSATYPLIVSDLRYAGYYLEDFEDGLAQDWTPLDAAHWSVVGGEYQAAAGDYGVLMQSGYAAQAWQDASISVHMCRTGGAPNVAAVFLRCTADFDYVNSVGSAYGLGISGNGNFWVVKWIDGADTWLEGWTSSPYLNTGETSNDVTLSIEGSEIRVYFNGNLAWSGSDASIPGPGSIVLAGYSGDSDPQTIHCYDDVLVQRPMTDGVTVSAEQAWHNLRGAAGDLNVAPTMDAAAAKYDGPTSEIAPLDIRAQSLDAPPFFMPDAPALPYSIAPGARLTLTVRYDPTWAGDHEQTLRITTNDATTPEVDVALMGTCYDPIQIDHTPLGTQYDEVAEYVIGATITSEKGLARAEVYWNADGGAYAALPMAMSGADWFEAAIPAQPIGTTVGYYIECEDVEGAIVRLPWDAPTTAFTFDVIGTPHLSAAPTSLSYVLAPDTQDTQAVELTNTGTGSLDWQVFSTSHVGVAGSASAFATDLSDDLHDGGRTPDWTKDHDADTLLVGFRKDRIISAAATEALHASVGATVAHRYRRIPVEVVRVPEGATPQSLASAYMASDLVAYVEPNYRVQATGVPNDPMFGDLWGLENTGQTGGTPGADISAPGAWDLTTGSADVIIGVIDTGIDYTHPDLVGNMWVNPSPTVGDVHGARWTSGDGTMTSGDPMDDHGHGTHCSGTIAATGDNGEGVAGVNWQASLMGLKFLDSSGFGDTADAISALEYAIDHGAHLTNNSWGGAPYSAALDDMIAQAQAANQLFIASAGNYTNDNDAVPYYPASYTNPNVISVAASDHDDNIAGFSHWGATSVDLAAPGVNIVSTVPGAYAASTGTSMAAPHVAGVAALVLSVAPNAQWDVVKGWILDSADVLPAWSGLTVTGGRLNAHETLITAGVSWLSMTPEAGTLAPGESVTVQVTADATGLPDGTEDQAQLLFTGDVDGPTPVDVSLLVAGGDFVVSPPDPLTFSGPEGGPFAPESGVYTLRNLGGAALQWTASGLPEWLDADDALSGELPAGGTATFTVRPSVLASGMPGGSYAGAVTFEEVGGASATFNRPVALEVAMPAPDPFYTDPFDADPGWTVEGQWAFGAPQGIDGDPAAAFTGSNVYGYNLAGGYANSIPEHFLTTTALDCSDYANVHLQFQRWLGVESSSWDHARIQASNDGATWVDVWNHVGGTVTDTAWEQVTYDMSAVADGQSTVYVRWGMGPTDGSVAYFGWNIDDLTLLGVLSDDLAIVPSTGFEIAGLEGGPFTPESIDYTLTNRGATAVTWSLAHAATWLDVSSTGGALDPGAHAVVTVSLNAAADSLTAGAYGDTLLFTNEDSGVTQERQVSLNVATAPVVNFAAGASTASEADGTVSVDVALSLASSLSVSVDYSVTGGTATGGGVDYTLASGTLDFAPGETGKPIVVTLNDDLTDEPDETVAVTLSNPVNAMLGAPDSHTLTITDDDETPQVAFAQSASSAGEADGIVPVDVVLSAASGLPVSVHYAVTGGTATGGGVDYTLASGTLDFAAGEQTKTIEALLTDDGVLEDAETVEISLDSPVNATLGAKDRHTVTITDLAPIALSADTAAEGMEGTAVRADADVTSATRAAEVYSAMRRDNEHWLLHFTLGLGPLDDIDALSIPESDCAEPGLFASDTALYGQSYGNQDNGVTPSATTGDGGAVYERFDGVGEPITSVYWWGVTRRVSDGAPETRDPDAYRVSFYADDAGEPGAEAAVYTVTPTRSATPLMAAGCTVYAFDAELPAPVELPTGWLSVYGVDDADTEFAWAHAQDSDGDGVSHRLVGATYDIGATDMAFALGGALTAGAPPLGVHWHFSVDPAAVGVEGIAPDLHSEASNAEASGDVFVSDGSARNALAVEETYLGLQAVAGGEPDNMDALDMRVIPLPTSGEHLDRDAVYFSLAADSPSLAAASGGPFAPGDLLASDGNGGFYAVATDDALGIAGEDMDALFVSASGEAFFSVAPGGPGGFGPGALLGADGVFGYAADGTAEVLVDAAGMGLAENDNLNGLDALAQPDERFNRLVVPFFLDSAPANEAAQTAGVRTWIAVKNLSPEDAPMMVQYVRANGSDITPDVYKHTLDPWQGLGWRPSVRDTGPEGEGIGANVPDTGDGSIAGSAIVSFLEGSPMAGRLIMTSPDSQAAFALPAVGETTKLVVPFYLDDAAGDGQLPSVGSQTYIGVKNLSPDPVRLRITYTKPTGVDITPEDNTYILPGYAGVSWRPTVDDGFNEGIGVDVPNATGMITGSATIEATGPIAGRLVQWSAGADGFMQCAYALPDAAGSDALVSPLFLDDAPNGGLPPAAGFMSYIGVKNLLTAPQDVDVAYRSRGGADRTPASASYTWTELLGISWRPVADDSFNEGVGANVPNITEGTEGSAVISGLGARLAGRFLASAPTDLFAHALPSAGGSKSLVVPFFQDNASVDGELFPETGMLSLIVVRNLTDADVPITITYQDRLGDATPAANTYTIPANATVAWRPRATDAGVEGADGAAVPDSTSPITAGSAEITAAIDALAGILITTSGDGASAYVLPAR